MTECYQVRVEKDSFTFSAAHFITFGGGTFGGGTCERLHGHNYRVAAQVEGPLDENHYVVDFIALRDTLRDLTAPLDHRVLLPTGHAQIKVVADAKEVTATFEDRRWVFPREDCVLLPVPNTTAEQLARHLAGQLRETLARAGAQLDAVRVDVDECDGQIGICELR